MRVDTYGRQILTEDDLCHLFMKNPDQRIRKALVDEQILIPNVLELTTELQLNIYTPLTIPKEQFDSQFQNNWFMPAEYKEFDIAKYVLDLCKTDEELQRVGEELILYQERDMFPLLRYCKYLVDTMKKNNVLWGVGRGSSVSSYVLYLIGIHRINSIYYDLSIEEFLK